jgi:hypothetical protein
MRTLVALAALFSGCLSPSSPSAAFAQSPFARLLPPATQFHLTLREQAHTNLPLGSSCGREAAQTLTCRAFVLTLENASTHTVRLSEIGCQGPSITIWRREPRSGGGWVPVSQPLRPPSAMLTWSNLRLTPGDRTEYETRLIAPHRSANDFAPGSYTLRASWLLLGCIEPPDGADCLDPLQRGSVPRIDLQEPVNVFSNEVIADSPALPDLGTLRFLADVVIRVDPVGNAKSTQTCSAETKTIDCTVFHYTVLNESDRPMRNTFCGCVYWFPITPEYRIASGAWKPVPQLSPRNANTPAAGPSCLANPCFPNPVLPGGTVMEGESILATLGPGYDTAPMREAGEYRLRFTFWPRACFASPDAAFCLAWPAKQVPVISPEITMRVR